MPFSSASSGEWTCFLLLLVLAESTSPGLLLFDLPEVGMHPHALRRVVRAAREETERGVTVVIASHAPVVIEQWREEPEDVIQVYPGCTERLTAVHDPAWLSQFCLGDLYGREVIGHQPSAKEPTR